MVLSCKVAKKLTITVSAGTVGTAVGVVGVTCGVSVLLGVVLGTGVVEGTGVVVPSGVVEGTGVVVPSGVVVPLGVVVPSGVVEGTGVVGVAVGGTKTLPRITFVVLLALTVAVLHPLPLLGSVLVQFAFGVSQTV